MNIKDYIHLYIGCECLYDWTYYNETDLFGKVTSKIIEDVRSPHLSGASTNVRPLLRPLSDMTEEEAVALVFAAEGAKSEFIQWHTESGEIGGKPFGFEWQSDHYRKGQRHNTWYESFEPEGTRYLLSRGFDLFGLIAAGLALDKTTYQSPQTNSTTTL
jgi:hypothetical protein